MSHRDSNVKLTSTAIAALALVIGMAFAPPAAMAGSLTPEQEINPAINGERHLGVDISDVNLTYPEVQGFIQSLSPRAQQGVFGACQSRDSWGGATKIQAHHVVTPFCEMASPLIAAGRGG